MLQAPGFLVSCSFLLLVRQKMLDFSAAQWNLLDFSQQDGGHAISAAY